MIASLPCRSIALTLLLSGLLAAPAFSTGSAIGGEGGGGDPGTGEGVPLPPPETLPPIEGGGGLPPGAIDDLVVVDGSGWCSAVLTWTVPDDGDLLDDVVSGFDVRFSNIGPITTEAQWYDPAYTTPLYIGVPDPGALAVGSLQTLLAPEMTGFPLFSARIWFGVRAWDPDGEGAVSAQSPSLDAGMARNATVLAGQETSSSLTVSLELPAGAAQMMVLGTPGTGTPATPLTAWVPAASSVVVGGLAPSTTYSIALKVREAGGEEGGLSAAPYATGATQAAGGGGSTPAPAPSSSGSDGGGCGASTSAGAAALSLLLAGAGSLRRVR